MAEQSIGALWKREGKNGTYLSGVVTVDGKEQRIVVFANSYKSEDKHPDYRILPSRPRQEAPQAPPTPEGKGEAFDDDLPF